MSETPALPTPDEPSDDGAWIDHVDQEALDREAAVCAVDVDLVSFEDLGLRDEDLLEIRGPVSEWDLPLLVSIDPATLDREGRLIYLRRVEAVEAFVSAMKAKATVAVAGTDANDSTKDRHVAMEVAQLCRVGEGSAASAIAIARALHVEFPRFLDALQAGEITDWHCRTLVSETHRVTDPGVIAALQDRLLPKAKRMTPPQFRREVRKAVADLDAERAAERQVVARSERYVTCKPLDDGLGYLGIVSDWPTISAMHAKVRDAGRRMRLARGGAKAVRAGADDALADACRADAMAALVLGTQHPDGSVVLDRANDIPISLTLVMDPDTLRAEADRHGLLDGEPVPADRARDYADAAKTWRRAITDPVTGHLLDYGREQYMPARFREYIAARDLCRAPGCMTQAVSRIEVDHAIPFPDGGTSAANGGGLCVKHHQLKTERLAHLLDSRADGSVTWLTAWGQRIHVPPRPFLHDPTDWAPPQAEAPSGPPGPPTWPGGDVQPPWRDPDMPPF